MVLEPLGESALILRELPVEASLASRWIEAGNLPGVTDVVCSYETVGVYFRDLAPTLADIEACFGLGTVVESPIRHLIPVCYELGEDLESSAVDLSLSPDELVRLHSGAIYRCYAIGFCPGFPYLGYLPEALCGVPRRSQPRVRVEPGSIAITGKQTGIYPLPRPGGWALIGRTPLEIVNVEDEYFPIRAGDEVQFASISQSEFSALKGQRL